MNAANLNLTIQAQSFDVYNYWFAFINSWIESQADHGFDMSLKCKKIKHDTRITLSLWKQLYNYLLTLIVINRVSQQA